MWLPSFCLGQKAWTFCHFLTWSSETVIRYLPQGGQSRYLRFRCWSSSSPQLKAFSSSVGTASTSLQMCSITQISRSCTLICLSRKQLEIKNEGETQNPKCPASTLPMCCLTNHPDFFIKPHNETGFQRSWRFRWRKESEWFGEAI